MYNRLALCCVAVLALLLNCKLAFAQKKVINDDTYGSWPTIRNAYLTSNGSFVKYDIVYPNDDSKKITVLKSVDGHRTIEIHDSDFEAFADDDQVFACRVKDTLIAVWLGSGKRVSTKISFCESFKGPHNDLLAYQDITDRKSLQFIGDHKKGHVSIPNIGEVVTSLYLPLKNKLVLTTIDNDRNSKLTDLKVIDLRTYKVDTLFYSRTVFQVIGSNNNENLAILLEKPGAGKELWLYSLEGGALRRLADTDRYSETDVILGLDRFDRSDSAIVVFAQKRDFMKAKSDGENIELEVWSYKDKLLPGELGSDKDYSSYYSVLSLRDEKLHEFNKWRNYFGVSVNDDLGKKIESFGGFSPDRRFGVYVEDSLCYSFDFSTGKTRCLTCDIRNDLPYYFTKNYDFAAPKAGIVGWGNAAVYIGGGYDIWKISLDGKFDPINITNYYGKTHSISFYLLNERSSLIDGDTANILVGFNNQTKENGFFRKKNLNERGDPEVLTFTNDMYWLPFTPYSYNNLSTSVLKPQKANRKHLYLVAKSRASESLNLYLTKDFRTFRRFTSNYPETNYNWYTTELVNWNNFEGIPLQGILYKPENFDSSKKYPLVIYSYRNSSNNLNAFSYPQKCPGCTIDIPTYVSNGYLVFTPDIYFTKGNPGRDAYSAIVSGVRNLLERKYVDSKKIGIQGCSFSGFTTNYIVTHTAGIFAAACSASGLFDFVSGYNSMNGGTIKQEQFESGPYQMGPGALWDNPQMYIENSPVLNADKLNVPFLIMHTTLDPTIPMWNAIEFFLAAKRLKKRVWMLQYGKYGHTVHGREGKDFNTRMRQFFDHYLKDSLPPQWMTIGRPSNLKGIEDRLELDTSGVRP